MPAHSEHEQSHTAAAANAGPGDSRALMLGLRYVLPAAVVLAGLIVMALGSESDLEGGAAIISAGLAIYAMNWLYRASVDGDRDRDAEEAARDYFDAHGRWPDDPTASGMRKQG